jgi:hypothetical protein
MEATDLCEVHAAVARVAGMLVVVMAAVARAGEAVFFGKGNKSHSDQWHWVHNAAGAKSQVQQDSPKTHEPSDDKQPTPVAQPVVMWLADMVGHANQDHK